MSYIYKITNLINGKIYIGKTNQTIERRWKEHWAAAKRDNISNRPLYKAFNKYGQENFVIEKIEECSPDIASEREIYWIETLGSFKYGYNATLGGDGKHYADYDLIYNLYKEGYNIKQIIKQTHYDKDTVATALEMQGISHEDRMVRGKLAIQHSVAQLDKNTLEILNIFPSVKEAYAFLNKSQSGHIGSVCTGKRKTAYGYKWKYL